MFSDDLSFFFYNIENKIDSLFIISSGIILGSSFRVIVSKNPLNSIISLIIVFFNSVILLMIYEVEFLAMIFLIVYIGAIAVLFLFIVYMLNIKILELQELNSKYLQGIFLGLVLFAVSLFMDNFFLLADYNINFFNTVLNNFNSYNNFELNWFNYSIFFYGDNLFFIATLLYSHYYLILILLGLILLVAMLGSIVLTSSKTVNLKEQVLFTQIKKIIK